MPYLNCPDCRLTVYSAARYSTADYCPGCGAPLGAVHAVLATPAPLAAPLPRSEPGGPAARSPAAGEQRARPTA